jgi:hypothetical protein
MSPVIAAIDVGNPSNTGWNRIVLNSEYLPIDEASGSSLNELIELLALDLQAHTKVALGFEAPLYVPLPEDPQDLCKKRSGEGNRPWSFGAGAYVTACAAQMSSWVLIALANRLDIEVSVGVSGDDFLAGDLDLLVWEAFVSGNAKNRDVVLVHESDAKAATTGFSERLRDGRLISDLDESTVFSVIGGAVLRSGLSTDLALLSSVPLVIKASDLTE